MIFPVLILCNELRQHLPGVLMWGFRCVCSQQRHNPTAETHGKAPSAREGTRWPWQLQSVLSHTTETKRIQQTCEGQRVVNPFSLQLGC